MNYLQFWWSKIVLDFIIAGFVIGAILIVVIIVAFRVWWVNRQAKKRRVQS